MRSWLLSSLHYRLEIAICLTSIGLVNLQKQKTRFKLKKLVLLSLPPKMQTFLQKTSDGDRSLPKIAKDYPKTSEDLHGLLKMSEGKKEVGKGSDSQQFFFGSLSKIAGDHPMYLSDYVIACFRINIRPTDGLNNEYECVTCYSQFPPFLQISDRETQGIWERVCSFTKKHPELAESSKWF